MIQANELRIGNWVTELIKNRIVAIDGIESNQDFVWVNYLNGSGQYKVGINDIEPMPLTPEILEKCGFVNLNYGWTKGDLCLFDFNYGKGNLNLRLNAAECPLPIVKHLHQLQNLYFSLTGEELTLKP